MALCYQATLVFFVTFLVLHSGQETSVSSSNYGILIIWFLNVMLYIANCLL